MATKLPNQRYSGSPASAPKGQVANWRKPTQLRAFSPLKGGKRFPPHFPPQPGPSVREPGAFLRPLGSGFRPTPEGLGCPLDIRQVAELIGCSPWTVRQTAIPRGLPHFRFGASGRLIFYRDQVIRWIENQQGGKTTK